MHVGRFFVYADLVSVGVGACLVGGVIGGDGYALTDWWAWLLA